MALVATATVGVAEGMADCTVESVGAEEGEEELVNNDGEVVGAEEEGKEEEGVPVTGSVAAAGAGVKAKVSDPTSTGSDSATSTTAPSEPCPS